MDEELKVTEQTEQTEPTGEKESIVETIVQNGVSKEELERMLKEILQKQTTSDVTLAQIAAAEQEYFSSHLKY